MGLSYVLGYDISLNSTDNEQEMDHFRDLVKGFIEYHYNSYYTAIIDNLGKQLDDVQKDLHKKESSISSLKKKEAKMSKKLDNAIIGTNTIVSPKGNINADGLVRIRLSMANQDFRAGSCYYTGLGLTGNR